MASRSGQPQAPTWAMLALLCAAQFMVVLDFSIVNVALPSIQHAFDLSQDRLQWLVSGYALTFGGLLLLGGRAADLVGRTRMFVAGLLLFAVASLLGGLSPSIWLLTVLSTSELPGSWLDARTATRAPSRAAWFSVS